MPLPLMALSLGARLLGVGKFLKDFVKDNWKWILPVAIVVAGYFYVNHKIDQAYDQGYDIGVKDEVTRQNERIAIENAKNREFETILTRIVTDFGKEIARESAERVVQESKIKDRVNTIIKENPIYQQCVVDPEVIDAQNALRRLGPEEGKPVVTVKFDEVK